jgi:uncharacterized protein DUF6364
MKNITLAIDEDLLKAARRYAAARDTTVNGLVREYLTRIATEDDRVAKARAELLKLAEASEARLGPGWKWNREELYDRPVLRRHKRPHLRRGGTR